MNGDAPVVDACFVAPEITDDDTIASHSHQDRLFLGDARQMDLFGDIADNSVASVAWPVSGGPAGPNRARHLRQIRRDRTLHEPQSQHGACFAP